jgi:hypothetical protein
VEQHSALEVPARRVQPLGVLREANTLAFDSLEEPCRQDDLIPADRWQSMKLHVKALVPDRQRHDMPAIHVPLAHRRPKRREAFICCRAVYREHLDADAGLIPLLASLDE